MHDIRSTIFALVMILILGACHGYNGQSAAGALSREQALALAVDLANERCQEDFAHAPFDASCYSIEFVEGRWNWGRLDPPGAGGFTAQVSFDSRGEFHEVEVCFNSDTMPPEESPDIPERK